MNEETTWEDIGTYQNLVENKKKTPKQCVRCGTHLTENKALRCKKCRERVDEEFRGEVSRPLEYYFKFNLKRRRHEDRKLSEMLKENGEKRE